LNWIKISSLCLSVISLFERDLRANAWRLSRGKNRFPLFRIVLYDLREASSALRRVDIEKDTKALDRNFRPPLRYAS